MLKLTCVNNTNWEDHLELGKIYYGGYTDNSKKYVVIPGMETDNVLNPEFFASRFKIEESTFTGGKVNDLKGIQSPLERQAGGQHYKHLAIQPIEYCQKNELGYCESNVVKYVTRHKDKNGREDIEKAIHMLELLLELEYNGN